MKIKYLLILEHGISFMIFKGGSCMKRITRRKVIRKYYMHDSFDDCEIDL